MTRPSSRNPIKRLRVSDVRGVVQLATHTLAGVTRTVEQVHQSVRGMLGIAGGEQPGQTGGRTGKVYQRVQGLTRLLGQNLDALLERLAPWLEPAPAGQVETPARLAMLAALNGVVGDRLAASGNPLAIGMSLRYEGKALDEHDLPPMPKATGKVLLLLHGLCMNELQWQVPGGEHSSRSDVGVGQGFGHGAELASMLDYTPVYLRYNSGLHVWQNGRQLAARLEQLLARWPVPIEHLTAVGHSMGGLVLRSAVHQAQQQNLGWPEFLKNMVFLGTPHHGAPLERAGNWLGSLLENRPYSAPFARLARLRSAGITDLRYGQLLEADSPQPDRSGRHPDNRDPVPLPAGVACYAVAGTLAARPSTVGARFLGDGLVPVHSALGQHADPSRNLAFAENAQWIACRINHMQLLRSPAVTRQMLQWLAPAHVG